MKTRGPGSALFEFCNECRFEVHSGIRCGLTASMRFLSLLIVGVMLVSFNAHATLISQGKTATSSEYLNSSVSPEFEGQNVIDGTIAKKWLLPDNTSGYVEIDLGSVLPIGSFWIFNTFGIVQDHTTIQFSIELRSTAEYSFYDPINLDWDNLKTHIGTIGTLNVSGGAQLFSPTVDGTTARYVRLNVLTWQNYVTDYFEPDGSVAGGLDEFQIFDDFQRIAENSAPQDGVVPEVIGFWPSCLILLGIVAFGNCRRARLVLARA